MLSFPLWIDVLQRRIYVVHFLCVVINLKLEYKALDEICLKVQVVAKSYELCSYETQVV